LKSTRDEIGVGATSQSLWKNSFSTSDGGKTKNTTFYLHQSRQCSSKITHVVEKIFVLGLSGLDLVCNNLQAFLIQSLGKISKICHDKIHVATWCLVDTAKNRSRVLVGEGVSSSHVTLLKASEP
jgi:hypothetical protein